ncbi:peptidoglycan DD-metalloendopeptidase family protein [Nocardioides sp. cx-169]|uniref:peptidoglycan DD-metalloendopeptidase family protein n=1 Tax=Nocardioides sp. cx-169 TaxID=2899080 RepID=UPI001E4178E9|nr:M23 family metallopeptidase [Nocardioides sp. cx-169]MCD4533948.1 peptidoglycan DD-metalloendopeptidase family protein [Nocardioides sp. cx-169]
MRFFPSASRQRVVVASVAAAVALGGTAVPLANASAHDPLKDKHKHVEQQIEQAHDDLGETSKQVQRTTARLNAVRVRLTAAKTHLDGVRVRLAEARAKDAEMQLKLVAAQEALAQARQDLLDGQEALATQRVEVVNTVNDIYESGDPRLLAFASLMAAKTPEDVVRQMGATDAIVGRQDRAYAGLHAAEIVLQAREDRVEAAKLDMETKRADAATNLAAVRELAEQARVARASVLGLLRSNRKARDEALSARAHDRQVLRELRKREARIKQQILAAAAQSGGKGGYSGATDGVLRAPTSSGYVTSPFGYRTHPIYGYYGLHDGTDFGVACGQSMLAVAGGTVMDTYYSSVYGNRLYLNLGNYNGKNLTAVYNHLSGYRASEGQRVRSGEVVGYAGSTGWSTGCHLHFTILVNGDPVDPMKYL